MLTIGLTGGIASGKSETARCFAALDVPVVDADALAREAVAAGSEGLAEVVTVFGRDVLAPDGTLDRRVLRRRIFADAAERRRLEAIVHPRVRAALTARLARLTTPYAVVVVPLLVESGLAEEMDRVLVVDCPEALQISRLLARDGESVTDARAILAAQIPRARRLAAADDVIVNDGTLQALEAAVTELHGRYLALAGTG